MIDLTKPLLDEPISAGETITIIGSDGISYALTNNGEHRAYLKIYKKLEKLDD
jgi:hypothetical protein